MPIGCSSWTLLTLLLSLAIVNVEAQLDVQSPLLYKANSTSQTDRCHDAVKALDYNVK
jgi:hypothetical protein